MSVNTNENSTEFVAVLHELVYALLGFTGDQFLYKPEHGQSQGRVGHPAYSPISLSRNKNVEQATERQLLDIAKLAGHYLEINGFVEFVTDFGQLQTTNGSLYLRALGVGLEEILEVYRAGVLRVQHHVLTSQHPSLLAIQRYLSEFQQIFPALHRVLYDLQNPKEVLPPDQYCKANHVLTALRCQTDPFLQQCIRRLSRHCHRVLLQQLSQWMLYGVLQDPCDEFFIVDRIHRQLDEVALLFECDSHKNCGSTFQQCVLDFVRLPQDLITQSEAQDVLFVGSAVRVLNSNDKFTKLKGDGVQNNFKQKFGANSQLSHEDVVEMTLQMKNLQDKVEFDHVLFAATLERFRSKVGQQLWRLFVDDSDLFHQLRAIQDYYFIQRGDFWNSFLHEIGPLIDSNRSPTNANIQMSFQTAAIRSTAEDDPYFSQFKIRKSESRILAKSGERYLSLPVLDDEWDNLYLYCEVPWPFLLRCKRVDMVLLETWFSACRGKGQGYGVGQTEIISALVLLRHFVSNLTVYLQQDVVAAGFEEFRSKMMDGNEKNYARLKKSHDILLMQMLGAFFMGNQSIVGCIEELFKAAFKLRNIVFNKENTPAQNILFNVEVTLTKLVTLIQRIQDRSLGGSGEQLQQFLLRLKYNEFQVQNENIPQVVSANQTM